MVRASRKNAAGVCKFVNSNPRPCPPGLVWDAKLKRCVPKTVTPQGDNSTDGNPNTDPNDCPPGWIWNPDTNKCTPKDVLPPEDHNMDDPTSYQCSDFDDVNTPESRHRCESHHGCVFVPESTTWGRCVARI